MEASEKTLTAREYYERLDANASDYMLLAAATAVPLYTSAASVLQFGAGLLFVMLAWVGQLISYMTRTLGVPPVMKRNVGWIKLVIAIFIAFNYELLNDRLPGGGFPWQLAPAAFLSWFIIFASFFLWTDDAMLFLVVPCIALFGIQSWIDTAGRFEISLVLFMLSIAVLLTRLHIRYMYASARAAGHSSLPELYSGPWRAIAGPLPAVVSVLVVAAASWIIAPPLGSAVRILAGEPELQFQVGAPPTLQSSTAASKKIGAGPISSSNLPVLRIETDDHFQYLRGRAYRRYLGTGWSQLSTSLPLQSENQQPISDIEDAKVYSVVRPYGYSDGRRVSALITAINRPHDVAYSPGWPLRVEADRAASLQWMEFVLLEPPLLRDDRLYVEGSLIEPTPQEMRSASPSSRARFNYGEDLISPRVRQLARRIAEAQRTDYDTVQAFIREITRRCKYNLKAEAIEGDVDRVEAFLFDRREGYCDLFASSLAVMCLSVGIRARVVNGFLIDEETRDGNTYIVRDRDFHMWTEVYFEKIGWVGFDPTLFAEAVPGGEVGALVDLTEENPTLSWAAWTGGTVFSLALLALVIGYVLAWLRARRIYSPQVRRIRPVYTRFLRILQKVLQRPKAPNETTAEYAGEFAQRYPKSEVMAIADSFDAAFFGPDGGNGDLRELQDKVREFANMVEANGR